MEEDSSHKEGSFSAEKSKLEEFLLGLSTDITQPPEQSNHELIVPNTEVSSVGYQEEGKSFVEVKYHEQAEKTETKASEEVGYLEDVGLTEEGRHQGQPEIIEEVKYLKEAPASHEASETIEETEESAFKTTDESTPTPEIESVPEVVQAEAEQNRYDIVSADNDADSEIEDICMSEREAEKAVDAVEEIKKPVYQEMLDIQKGYDSQYIAYLAEINQLNRKFEAQVQEVYEDRKQSATKIDNFWLTALRNNPLIAASIEEKDIQLLQHLKDISYIESHNGRELTLKFEFSENEFIEEQTLIKTYLLDSDGNLKKTTSSKLTWKGDDFTTKQVIEKRKNRRGKGAKTVPKTVSTESFFNLFKEVEDFSDSDDSEACIDGMLGDDLELGHTIRDEIVPYAFMWFLGVLKGQSESNSGSKSKSEPEECRKVVEAGGNPSDCKQQ